MAEPDTETGTELEPRARLTLEAGFRLAGAITGGAIGGPAGAAVGWAVAEGLQVTFNEVIERVGRRGAVRASAALALIGQDLHDRDERGETRREDGFFEPPAADRMSSAEELFESVLRQAAEAVEEQKLPYLSRIYSTLEFDSSISAAEGHYLVGLAARLTYRQLIALSVYAHYAEHSDQLIMASVNETEGEGADPGVRLELTDLLSQQLLGIGDDYRVSAASDPFRGLVPRDNVGYGQLRLLPAGETLARVMGLEKISAEERQAWLAALGSS